MMTYERQSGISSPQCLTFTDENLSHLDCQSIALNDQETHLLLAGQHELALINFEANLQRAENARRDENNGLTIPMSDIKVDKLFDTCNVNRPIVQWSHVEANQYAVAIDRICRLYTVENNRFQEANGIIDSQHQRPITTIAYSPHDSHRLLTGSLDGQIHVWDTRQCFHRNPPSSKLNGQTNPNARRIQWTSTSFSIRRIQWSPIKSDNTHQIAVQCDRCIRLYDLRRTDASISHLTDIEFPQRIANMDWNNQTRSIVSLSSDHSIRIHSASGQALGESQTNESATHIPTRIRNAGYDNLFVCASRDPIASTYGFVGWRWDEDRYLRPLTDRVVSTTPSPIADFCLVNKPRLINIWSSCLPVRSPEQVVNRFLLLTWCRDGQLCLVDMDSTFRQAWNDQYARMRMNNPSDSPNVTPSTRTSPMPSRQHPNRSTSSITPLDVIKDESIDGFEDEHCFEGMSTSPSNTIESPETDEDNEISTMPDRTNNTLTEVSVATELNSLLDDYGMYIHVENKDEQRRMCILQCTYSLDSSLSFRIYLILSRHYPIISQLSVRFKMSTVNQDERLKEFQTRIQVMFEQTSHQCFYHGQLCLHKCLIKLKSLFDTYFKQEKMLSVISNASHSAQKTREHSRTNSELDSPLGLMSNDHNSNTTNNNNGNRMFGGSSSSTRTSDSQISSESSIQAQRRTCGARFCGPTHLICFGRTANAVSPSSAPALTPPVDALTNRPQSLPMRSTSLTMTKIRENSNTEESSSYRPPPSNIVQIQQTPNHQRFPMFSAPVRSSIGSHFFTDHPRVSTNYRRSLGQLTHPHSTVSIYDVSILLPVSKKLADDYQIDLNNPIEMCKSNLTLTTNMAKEDLVSCWRLIGGLLSLQPNLEPDDPWFQTPLAQGLIKHLVSNYVMNGDIQSASMFLLTMSQTPYLKTKIQSKLVNEHRYDPVLYSYASLLHRWKHFYRRTQILSQIDHNCQSPAPLTSNIGTVIICAICSQPVLGQYILCAACGHGGHLTHMHEWFAVDETKHLLCPEKDCSCRCIYKQQELLAINNSQIQQQPQVYTPGATSRTYLGRQLSGGIRPL